LLALVVVVLVRTLAGPGDDDQPYVVPRQSATSAPTGTVDAPGAAEALQRLASALGSRDRAAATALAATGDAATAARLGDLADVATDTRMSDIALRYIDDDGGLAADGTWSASVDATWAYAGFDARPSSTEVAFRFRTTPGGVVVAGVGGGSLRTPVWMSGPMQVSRTADLLVVAAADVDLAQYVRRARAAVPTVSSVLTDWRSRLVFEVPSDAAALEAALGAEAGYYGQIAAVTGSSGEIVRGAPIHVFVNPDVFNGLGADGQEVVLAHEATHVATDAPLSKAPTWLIEGFADYVALRGTRLPLTRTAGQVARQVADDGLPAALPTSGEFDTRGPHLGAVYEASWLVCVTLAERGGTNALVRFYDDVSAGGAVADSLERDFDWSEPNLVAAWQRTLETLPGSDR
jgi:hypothetical protein